MNKVQLDALDNWITDVTGILCYQPIIPEQHKRELVESMEVLRQSFSIPSIANNPSDVPLTVSKQ